MAQWKPGESGNPNGRPRKQATLTAILKTAGEETSNLTPGSTKKFKYNEILAQYVWKAVIFGRFKFRDGREIIFDEPGDWLTLVKWLYDRIDGPPKQAFSVDANMLVELVWADENNSPSPTLEPENDS